MSLIATARAMDDARFLWRVRAAAVTIATSKVNLAASPEQKLAKAVLNNPMRDDQTMAAFVACNPTVSAAISVDEFDAVSTEAVTDEAILAAVDAAWTTVATQRAGATSTTAPLG